MIKATTPTLARIKRDASETDVRALLSLAICEVCDFFNVGKNMNDTQVAITVDFIIEEYWYMRLEEIKYCFRQAMRTERVYDRMDGNIILGWLAEYAAARAEESCRLSREKEIEAQSDEALDDSRITLAEYKELLSARADKGDEKAQKRLSDIESAISAPTAKLDKRESMRDIIASEKWFDALAENIHPNKR